MFILSTHNIEAATSNQICGGERQGLTIATHLGETKNNTVWFLRSRRSTAQTSLMLQAGIQGDFGTTICDGWKIVMPSASMRLQPR